MHSILRARAAELDAQDTLSTLRGAYALPDEGLYLVGNSLGPPLRSAAARASEFVEQQWGAQLVRGWTACDWMAAPLRVGDQIGRMIGAAAGQVVVGDTTTLQLYRALAAALAMRPQRSVLLVEQDNFPADNYIAQGLAHQFGDRVQLHAVPGDQLASAMERCGSELAVFSASHVNYRSATVRDMHGLTARAHAHGALAVWDLAHSAGVIETELDAREVDFAVGCTYKYLNGGPGSPAFLYVATRHHELARSPTWGWLGHSDPFAMRSQHEAAPGIAGFLCGTPRMVALDALEHALAPLLEVDLGTLRTKSVALTELFVEAVLAMGSESGLELLSPRMPDHRGSHVALGHAQARRIVRALESCGVQADYRAPKAMRFGFAPAYLRHVDVVDAAAALAEVLRTRAWDDPAYEAARRVT